MKNINVYSKEELYQIFLNRVDEIITFDSLTKDDLLKIIDLLLF